MKKFKLLCTAILTGIAIVASALEILPQKAVILYEAEVWEGIKSFSACDLQHHLEMMTGVKIPLRNNLAVKPGEYPFFIGVVPPTDKVPLKPEEGRFLVTPQGAYIYGRDVYDFRRKAAFGSPEPVLNFRQQTGTYFAMLEFLEKEFGFRWIAPGDKGTIFQPTTSLKMDVSSGAWNPGQLVMREFRHFFRHKNYQAYRKEFEKCVPDALLDDENAYQTHKRDTLLWLKRQRMGLNRRIRYGHAFTQWKKRFLPAHPDYFAVNEKGQMYPFNKAYPLHFQLCFSNPAVLRQMMEDYRKAPGDTMNLCPNDGGNHCQCERCKSWDVPGTERGGTLSDRYIKYANIMQGMLDKEYPGVSGVMYAYSKYRFPPRREKVNSNLIIGFVPEILELKQIQQMYEEWFKAGVKKIFLRPNDFYLNTGLPMGFEKQIWEGFQIGLKHNIIATDYSALFGYGYATGIADYILARAHVHPEMSFEALENEYVSAFGAAAEELKAYYRYYRNEIWEKRLVPNRKKILERGRYGNFRRGIIWDLEKYYKPEDFDRTDAILQKAAAKQLAPAERERLESVILSNRHARMVLMVISAKEAAGKLKAARELYLFRVANKEKLCYNWSQLIQFEKETGDNTGTQLATGFGDCTAVQSLPVFWQFCDDPKGVGDKEEWHKLNYAYCQKNWFPIYILQPWELQYSPRVPQALRLRMRKYDGIGYYSTNAAIPKAWKDKGRIFAYFTAVDESAWVYLNGQLCGTRLNKNPDDWQKPFEIELTDKIKWNNARQHLMVKVEDRGGQGGIWRAVFLTLKSK